jgi:hypothetical protein
MRHSATGARAAYRAIWARPFSSSASILTWWWTWNPECGQASMESAVSGVKRPSFTNAASTRLRKTSVRIAGSWKERGTNVPSSR